MNQLSLLDLPVQVHEPVAVVLAEPVPEKEVETDRAKPAPVPSLSPLGKSHHELAAEIKESLPIASDGRRAGYVLSWRGGQPCGVSVKGRFYSWSSAPWKIVA